ncbi:hypothetical protein R1flu_003659 [Riccia fluitans]|uniref:Uncharacterized protein n=1 Tax=Riccia fluitans TaxID=41844 RepID=A0ABD1YAK9_9MARC
MTISLLSARRSISGAVDGDLEGGLSQRAAKAQRNSSPLGSVHSESICVRGRWRSEYPEGPSFVDSGRSAVWCSVSHSVSLWHQFHVKSSTLGLSRELVNTAQGKTQSGSCLFLARLANGGPLTPCSNWSSRHSGKGRGKLASGQIRGREARKPRTRGGVPDPRTLTALALSLYALLALASLVPAARDSGSGVSPISHTLRKFLRHFVGVRVLSAWAVRLPAANANPAMSAIQVQFSSLVRWIPPRWTALRMPWPDPRFVAIVRLGMLEHTRPPADSSFCPLLVVSGFA